MADELARARGTDMGGMAEYVLGRLTRDPIARGDITSEEIYSVNVPVAMHVAIVETTGCISRSTQERFMRSIASCGDSIGDESRCEGCILKLDEKVEDLGSRLARALNRNLKYFPPEETLNQLVATSEQLDPLRQRHL